MNIEIRKARPEDAETILENLKKIGAESDNLTFGGEGLPFTVEQEQEYIRGLEGSRNALFVALVDGKIVGDASFSVSPRERLSHRGEFGVSILKEYWGMGIGSRLLERVVDFAKNEAGAELVSLEVRCDNLRAIKLYERYGFEYVGRFKNYMKVGGESFDVWIMTLSLK